MTSFSNPVNYKKPIKKTNHAVIVKNTYGDDVVIYYARDKCDKERFMNTAKFKNLKFTGWKFKDDGTFYNKSIYEKPSEKDKTLFEVIVSDPDNPKLNHIIYYARDQFDKERFMNTEKFKNLKLNGWEFTSDI